MGSLWSATPHASLRRGSFGSARGLVASLPRPGGNLTGVSFLSTITAAIRVQRLHEAVPNAAVVGALINPSNPKAAFSPHCLDGLTSGSRCSAAC
jgi:ABC-type uncharacterized transport system substrate-binding protein